MTDLYTAAVEWRRLELMGTDPGSDEWVDAVSRLRDAIDRQEPTQVFDIGIHEYDPAEAEVFQGFLQDDEDNAFICPDHGVRIALTEEFADELIDEHQRKHDTIAEGRY